MRYPICRKAALVLLFCATFMMGTSQLGAQLPSPARYTSVVPEAAQAEAPTPPAEERLRKLEQTNEALRKQLETLNRKIDALPKTTAKEKAAERRATQPRTKPATPRRTTQEGGLRTSAEKEAQAEGGTQPPVERGPYVPDMGPIERKIETTFKEGLRWATTDGFFSLEFHNLTQADLRVFDPSGDPLHTGFIIPRQRESFQGHLSEYVNYYTVLNRGYGSLDILDSWADFNFGPGTKDYFQLRIGRMRTPYTYEYIKISASDLVAPERSVFVGNFAPNRELGAMAHGRVLNKQVEYYVGAFNGPRRSFEDFNNGKDLFFFTNTKPFLYSDIDFLRNLNVGGSFNFGQERNPLQPFSLRTANDLSTSPAAGNVSPTFLAFNNNVFENGLREQWSLDLAYYYKSFGLLAGYQGGFQDYSLSSSGTAPGSQALRLGTQEFVGVNSPTRTRVPLLGYSVAVNYFLTGEEITRRSYLLEPIRPLSLSGGEMGLGAWEVYSRFSYLHVGSNVFSSGLTTAAPWSNTANVVDTGVNWYLNHYVKLTFDWQHSFFPDQVYLAPGKTTKHFDLYWLRTQVFF